MWGTNRSATVAAGLLVAACSLGAAPSTATENDPEPDTPPAAASATVEMEKPDTDYRVCRKVKVVGSYVRKEVCRSQRDWARMQRDVERGMRNPGPLYEGRPGPEY